MRRHFRGRMAAGLSDQHRTRLVREVRPVRRSRIADDFPSLSLSPRPHPQDRGQQHQPRLWNWLAGPQGLGALPGGARGEVLPGVIQVRGRPQPLGATALGLQLSGAQEPAGIRAPPGARRGGSAAGLRGVGAAGARAGGGLPPAGLGAEVSAGIHRFSPQIDWLTVDRRLGIDHVARLETIDADMRHILRHLGLPGG